MKKIRKTIFLFLFHILTVQGQWSDPIYISGGTTPDLDIDRNTGALHIVTMINGVTYTRLDADGNLILQEIVTGAEYDRGQYAFGATVAVDQDGHPHICYRTFPEWFDFADAHYINRREGRWTGHIRLSGFVERGFPIRMAIDEQNRVHIARIHALSTIEGILTYFRIINGGLERTQEWNVEFRPDHRLEIDTMGDNDLHIVTGNPKYPQGQVFYFRSYNGGSNIDFVGDIHSLDCVFRNGSPDVCADQTGKVHIVYGASIDEVVENYPSIRYIQYQGTLQTRHDLVTEKGWLESYPGPGVGMSSVASSDDGKVIVIVYATQDMGDLYALISRDQGASWSVPELLAQNVDARPDGRGKHVVRSVGNDFYLLYAETSSPDEFDLSAVQIKLRYIRNLTDAMLMGVTGQVTYYANQALIPDVRIHWEEEANNIDVTDSQGTFNYNLFPYGSAVTLKPNKTRITDPVDSPLLSYDAAMVARTTVGLVNDLSDEQKTAADVDSDGQITMFDAVQIARYVVGFPSPENVPVGGWKFSPQSMVFDPLVSNMTDQNFTGILIGDVHGGWNVTNQQEKELFPEWLLSISDPVVKKETLSIQLGSKGTGIFSWDMVCLYDPNLLQLTGANIINGVKGIHLEYKNVEPGVIRLGLFSTASIPDGGPVVSLSFKTLHPKKKTSLNFRHVYLNTKPVNEFVLDVITNGGGFHEPDSCWIRNFPNPFNEVTIINYHVPRESWVKIKIINILGQEVKTLLNEVQPSGYHHISWDGRSESGLMSPSGVYFSLLQLTDNIAVGRMEKLR